MLQWNLDVWHNLLQASGGILNPSKCMWSCFNWKFVPNSRVSIVAPPPNLPELYMMIHNETPTAI